MLKQMLVLNVSTVLKEDLRRQKKREGGEALITGREKTVIKAERSEITTPSNDLGNLTYFRERAKMLVES